MNVKESLSELPIDMLKKELLKRILEQEIDISDEKYQISFEETYKVNLDVDGIKGYQIFEPTNYSYKYDEHLEDPDVTIMIRDMDFFKRVLQGEEIENEWGREAKYVKNMNKIVRKIRLKHRMAKMNRVISIFFIVSAR